MGLDSAGSRPEPGVSTGPGGAAASANKLHRCFHCGYCTHKKFNLDNHLRIHTGEKPFACSHCQYRAATKETLRRHILIHTGEKPYACKVCPYRCTQSGSLKNHMLTHHSRLATLPVPKRWYVCGSVMVEWRMRYYGSYKVYLELMMSKRDKLQYCHQFHFKSLSWKEPKVMEK